MTARDLERYDRSWRVLRLTLGSVTRLLLRPRATGTEHIPTDGPVLIVSNHLSWWDIPSIGLVQPRTIRYMAKAELFRVPVIGRIIAWGGAFPVRRGEADRDDADALVGGAHTACSYRARISAISSSAVSR